MLCDVIYRASQITLAASVAGASGTAETNIHLLRTCGISWNDVDAVVWLRITGRHMDWRAVTTPLSLSRYPVLLPSESL